MNAGENSASPQTLQNEPCRGRIASRQCWQTGSLETSINGEPQMRQSAGKRVKNKLAAVCFAQSASELPAWPWVARIRNPVLLKTASRNPEAPGAPARATNKSIAASYHVRQRAPCDQWLAPFGFLVPNARGAVAPLRARSLVRMNADNNARIELDVTGTAPEYASRRTLGDARYKLLDRHIQSSGIPQKAGSKRRGQKETQTPPSLDLSFNPDKATKLRGDGARRGAAPGAFAHCSLGCMHL